MSRFPTRTEKNMEKPVFYLEVYPYRTDEPKYNIFDVSDMEHISCVFASNSKYDTMLWLDINNLSVGTAHSSFRYNQDRKFHCIQVPLVERFE